MLFNISHASQELGSELDTSGRSRKMKPSRGKRREGGPERADPFVPRIREQTSENSLFFPYPRHANFPITFSPHLT